MALGRDEKKHISCQYNGREKDCPKTCEKCGISLKTEGDLALSSGQVDLAEKQYKRALFLEPFFAEAWCNLANLYGMKGEYNNSLIAFDKALSIDPVYGKAMFGKAITLHHLGETKAALLLTNQILTKYHDPDVVAFQGSLIGNNDEDLNLHPSFADEKPLNSRKEIIDTFDEQRRDPNFTIGDRVSINIEQRLADASRWRPSKLIGSTQKYNLYSIDGYLIGEDITTRETYYFGHIHLPAAVFHEHVFWFHYGNGMFSEKFISESAVGDTEITRHHWLSNKRSFATRHYVYEDNVEDMFIKDDCLYIQVQRRSNDGGVYNLVVTEENGEYLVRKEIVSGPMTRLNLNTYSEILKQHFQEMLYIYSTYYKQTCAKLEEHEARFEMLPALYSLAEYAFRIKNTDGSHDLNAIYDEVIKDGLSSLHNEEDIQKRIQEYRIILNGKQPRSECLLECDREENAESPVYRAVTMLCDRFVNPECTNNYFYAPAIVLENMDISYFVMDIYRPIGWEMNHLVSDFLSV